MPFHPDSRQRLLTTSTPSYSILLPFVILVEPNFHKVRVLFRGFVRLDNRAFLGPAPPVRRLPFPAAPFGFSCRSVLLVGFTPPAILSSGSLPPRSHVTRQLHPNGQIQVRLSCGLVPYNARQKQAPVSPGGFQPPAPSVLRVSHPLDVFLRL